MLHDFRFALRHLATHRWFSLAVVVTLALGIGVNTTVFTLVNAVLFKPVPVPGGERLVAVTQHRTGSEDSQDPVSLAEYRAYRDQNHSFDRLEAANRFPAIVSEKDNPAERYQHAEVTPGLFSALQTPPILGRAFTAADGEADAPVVVLLGHAVWQKRYAGSPDVIGRAIRLNDQPATIVGVMPADFQFPDTQEMWSAYRPSKEREERTRRELMLFGLLKPGVSPSAAQGDLAVIAARLAQDFPDTNKDLLPRVQTFHDLFNGGPIKLIFLLMLAAVGFVLLIACANVANLMLSRALARSREIAVRAALGASRGQLIRQLLVESVLLSLLGGVLGLALSTYGVHWFDLHTEGVGKPYWVQFGMDWRAFAYFAAISVASGLVFGLVPALRASRVDLNTALKSGSAAAGWRGGRLTAALVIFQFAATVVLLASAGLMIRNILAVQQVNPFVPADRLLTAFIYLPDRKGERYEGEDARRAMHERLLTRLAALPGVSSAVLSSDFPGLGSQVRDVEIEGRPAPDPKQPYRAASIFSSANYLAAIQVPLLFGHALTEDDGVPGKETAVVSRAFAEHHWPGDLPLGRRFRLFNDGKPGPWVTIVGVCGDLVQNTQDRVQTPVVYLSHRQEPWAWLGLMLRTEGDPAALARSLRVAVQELDADLPLFDVRTLREAIAHNMWFLSVFGMLFLAFAVIALLMASVGLYAVVAQNTARRTREIGIRMALGATAGRVVRQMLKRGLVQLGIGLVLGLAGAFAATRLLDRFLGLVSPHDPATFAVVAALLAAIGTLASWLPARRAAHVEPTEALRAE